MFSAHVLPLPLAIGLMQILGLSRLLVDAVYLNDFDGELTYQCKSSTQAISRVRSIHDNGSEDRRFDLDCREISSVTSGSSASCAWSVNYENAYDKALQFLCSGNRYISGMHSIHDNGSEDRKWKFYCCSIPDVHLQDCSLTGWTNDYDQAQDYQVPTNKVMKGVSSIHDNGPEDRRYEYEICTPASSDGTPLG